MPAPTPDPDPRDLFDQTILPDLPDLPPDLLSAFRDTYVAGYRRALQEVSSAVSQATRAALRPSYPPDYLGRSTDPTAPRGREM
jgi:hypothetical protein